MKNKIAVIGGDLRQIYLANIFSNNNQVFIFGNEHKELFSNVKQAASIEEAVKDASFIICPIPFSKDNEHIFAANSKQKIIYKDLFNLITSEQYIFSGPYTEEVFECAKENNIHLFDIVAEDEFAILNSIPTAEGVLSMMIENVGITLANNKCLILGYGRCGMAIGDLAKKLNMDVYIASTNNEELIMATINKLKTAKIQDSKLLRVDYLTRDFLDDSNFIINLEKFNYIINTIPVALIDINLSKKLDDYIFIDIANVYEDNTNRFINARGIPGKYSPKTAAEIISDVIEKEIYGRNNKSGKE
ncbi:dipicolinate synthase subunit DpsA [Vallitalea sp.]|jgi:dipicolinate synthase subunit A|uniref:dipicolinate synthase subunit DpsA n=1 Tax=Vallitalea sp. TaxID=1882829 RepID=UPI0025D34B95|nr:dipicolinate synthase subunit DpsA [Vallitalea sp.]MCT4687440.1 dipicolinate synthase subunit DpsA [Vallitalea sp.]